MCGSGPMTESGTFVQIRKHPQSGLTRLYRGVYRGMHPEWVRGLYLTTNGHFDSVQASIKSKQFCVDITGLSLEGYIIVDEDFSIWTDKTEINKLFHSAVLDVEQIHDEEEKNK